MPSPVHLARRLTVAARPTAHLAGPPGWHERATPADIRAARWVHEMLAQRAGFDAVGVEVHEGTATLTGTVTTLADAEEATRLAASVRGVVHVCDHLRVQEPGD